MANERAVTVKSPLGDDVLLFRSLRGSEQLGRLFEFDLEVLSEDEAIKLEDMIGQNVTVKYALEGGERFFNGFVSRFSYVGRAQGYARYQAQLRPWLWFLTRTADSRIFQAKTVPDIVKQIFREYEFSDFEEKLDVTYSPFEYCVQYRETDFNFISRLLEQEGIYYYFLHEDGKHTMVLADAFAAHQRIPEDQVTYYPPSEGVMRDEPYVRDWTLWREVQTGAYTLNDYDFKKPKASLVSRATVSRPNARAEYEFYDAPGEYTETSEGDPWVKVRLEEIQTEYAQVSGACDVPGFVPGGLFELAGFPRDDQNREHLIVSAAYELRVDEYRSEGEEVSPPEFDCTFTALESGTPFRPARLTPKPSAQGPATAIVVGPAGEEIYTDEYGRIKVQFHWDREGKSDENSSCWMRVAHHWAGKNWGSIHIPRIGQEVMIEFLEGDPDLPIVTGRVYNADNMPPYDLPSNKTQSGLKSRSSPGGGVPNFNELRFEDKKGSEEIYFHAEKNFTQIVENDRSEDVGHDRSLHVGHDKSEAVDNNKSITVGVDHTESIGSNKTMSVGASHTETIGTTKTLSVGTDHTESIGSNMTITVGSSLTETVALNYAETVGVAMELTIGAAMTETVGAAKAQTIGANKSVTVGADHSVTVGSKETVTIGGDKIDKISGALTMQVGKDAGVTVSGGLSANVTKDAVIQAQKVAITAKDSIVLETGSAMISMKSNGDILIKGKNIILEGSGNITMTANKILQN